MRLLFLPVPICMELHRIFAAPYAWSPASCRVLEEASYLLESRLRATAFKAGKIVDQFLHASANPDL